MKKIASLLLLILMAMSICLVSCGSYNENDAALAEESAEKAATEYFEEYLEGNTVGSSKINKHSVTVESNEYKSGKYVVTVKLNSGATGANPDYPGLTVWSAMNIIYTVKVKNGVAEVVDYEYILD